MSISIKTLTSQGQMDPAGANPRLQDSLKLTVRSEREAMAFRISNRFKKENQICWLRE